MQKFADIDNFLADSKKKKFFQSICIYVGIQNCFLFEMRNSNFIIFFQIFVIFLQFFIIFKIWKNIMLPNFIIFRVVIQFDYFSLFELIVWYALIMCKVKTLQYRFVSTKNPCFVINSHVHSALKYEKNGQKKKQCYKV